MGEKGRTLSGVDFDIDFERKGETSQSYSYETSMMTLSGSEWRMTKLRIPGLVYEGQHHQMDLGRRTVEGDAVYAPLGLCFSCTSGKFRLSKIFQVNLTQNYLLSRSQNVSNSMGVSLEFPNWKMQVFEVMHFLRRFSSI